MLMGVGHSCPTLPARFSSRTFLTRFTSQARAKATSRARSRASDSNVRPTRVKIVAMLESEFVVDQLKCSFDGEAWHGPALMEILDGVDAQTAAARPVPGAHSIWELVLHIAAWEQAIKTRIVQRKALQLTDEQNFPRIADSSDAAWRQALENLRRGHEQLIATVLSLNESQLGEQVPGKSYDIRFMLMGAAQHAAYHGGQIALLKKP